MSCSAFLLASAEKAAATSTTLTWSQLAGGLGNGGPAPRMTTSAANAPRYESSRRILAHSPPRRLPELPARPIDRERNGSGRVFPHLLIRRLFGTRLSPRGVRTALDSRTGRSPIVP